MRVGAPETTGGITDAEILDVVQRVARHAFQECFEQPELAGPGAHPTVEEDEPVVAAEPQLGVAHDQPGARHHDEDPEAELGAPGTEHGRRLGPHHDGRTLPEHPRSTGARSAAVHVMVAQTRHALENNRIVLGVARHNLLRAQQALADSLTSTYKSSGQDVVSYLLAAHSFSELIDHVRSRIAHYKAPRGITFVAELPKTATGKIQKYVLRGGAANLSRQLRSVI